MKKLGLALVCSLIFAACSQTGSGSTEAYGEIKGGVETSQTRTGN